MPITTLDSVLKVPQIDHAKVGKEFRERRVKAGLTLKQMEQISGFSDTFISELERGTRNWTPANAERLLAALKG